MKGLNLKACLVLLLMVTIMNTESRQPVLHRVGGGKYTWKPNVNFTDWAFHEQFYVGDWLYFGFDKQLYTVLQVNKTSYESCNSKCFIKNITRGGRDVFNLTEAKPYYFISGRGYCFKGMKVAIIAQDFPAQTNGSLPINISNGASNPATKFNMLVMVASALAWIHL
ncbi:hypothetical protein PTKIN_Ptkin11bG0015600 [Pterospermum kingtungense]